jgi:SNF2 family DNA or RNA helicase
MRVETFTPEIEDELSSLTAEARKKILFIENHPMIEMHWYVSAFDKSFIKDFSFLNSRPIINPFQIRRLAAEAERQGYRMIWLSDPTEVLDWIDSLDNEPDVLLQSELPGTISGFLPFQIQGYNFLKTKQAGIANWSTGTGKSVLACGLVKHHFENKNFDVCLWVVKTHNKINTQRTMDRLTGLGEHSVVIDGSRKKRITLYEQAEKIDRPIIILNYEKFRDDPADILRLIEGKSVFIIWDEMPTKLKNRDTKLYRAIVSLLYQNKSKLSLEKIKPKHISQVMLSATPIENSPEDFFNCVRLMDPTVFGTVKEFHSKYVASFSRFGWKQPERWKNLDLMGAKAAHMTHQVDKNDKDIASQFPNVIDEIVYVDMGEGHKRIYDLLMGQYQKDMSQDLDAPNMLSRINVAQMLLNHPRSVLISADRREDAIQSTLDGIPDFGGSEFARRLVASVGREAFAKTECEKLDVLQDILESNDGKCIVFTSMNATLIPLISEALDKWKCGHVVYHGSLSMKEKQEAEDRFKNDPNIRVFVSSDAGSDSINLEIAKTVVHYDMPWKWSTLIQRQNRAHRITSEHDHVRYYTLMFSNTVEERKRDKILLKENFHDAVLRGSVAEISGGARLGRKELKYILFGS